MKNKNVRLDEVLIKEGLVKDRGEAFIIVTEGKVFVEGEKMISPARMVRSDAKIEVRRGKTYVGRGAFKLEAALKEFKIDVSGKICADVGSATGGFTEVLLNAGAKKVYAIDTAKGKLAPKLRDDERVVVMEDTDVRDIDGLPEKVDLAVMDISLIPLEGILPSVERILKKDGEVAALFKPQYETRDNKVLRHGIVKDDESRQKLLDDFASWAEKNGWNILKQIESPIKGGEGNKEFLFHLTRV